MKIFIFIVGQKKLKEKLLAIQFDPTTLPWRPLGRAANYTLGEYNALCNYILRHNSELDNNAIERILKYINLSRRNY